MSLQIRNATTGASWNATTWAAGGYQIALPTGSYHVTFSGGGLAAPVTKPVTIGTANVKLDLDLDLDAGATPPPRGDGRRRPSPRAAWPNGPPMTR
ncbi:MAG: hypothetical protein K0Q71_6392 [Thermomicrobiales bacterium]|nr:hypothetical protein [Thermomicrobiales bacterium]